jgi:hypothetical protein
MVIKIGLSFYVKDIQILAEIREDFFSDESVLTGS